MPKVLRVYQNAANDAAFEYIRSGQGYAPLIVAPVGSGKSLIQADIIKRILSGASRRMWIISLAHVKELLVQNAEELSSYMPEADYGFYCSGLGQKRLYNDVTFASIQSIHNKVSMFTRVPDVLLIDEAHLAPHNEATTYRRFINDCLALNPNLVIIGLTGTPFRADSGRLDEGDGHLFTGVAYEISLAWMIEQGYLVKPVTPKVSFKMDVTGVQTRNGDYISGQLEKAVDVDETTRACVSEILYHATSRRKVMVFAAGVQHAEHIRDELRRNGVSADMVLGETDSSERKDIIQRYKRGDVKFLVNVAALTTGFNVPDTDMLVFMRPTKSPVLYIQMAGRGIRPVYAKGYDLETQDGRLGSIANSIKPECLLVDFGGVVEALGPIDTIDIRRKVPKEGLAIEREAPTKKCPRCNAECATSQKYCYSCGYSFASAALETQSSSAAVVSSDVAPVEHPVISMELEEHTKKGAKEGGLKSLKVTYITLAGHFSEYVCFEHHIYEAGDPKRFAWNKATQWHKARFPDTKPPTSVSDALWQVYPTPSHVKVKQEGKYWRVLDCRFDEPTEMQKENLESAASKLEKQAFERDYLFEKEGMDIGEIPF